MSQIKQKVILTPWEYHLCDKTGREREQFAVAHEWTSRWGRGFYKNIIGCMGECGVAKLLNLYWPAWIGTDRLKGDLMLSSGTSIQVRCTSVSEWSEREALSYDAQNMPYIFSVAIPAERCVWISGWCMGKEIPQRGEWKEHLPKPAWAIKLANLEEMIDFPEPLSFY